MRVTLNSLLQPTSLWPSYSGSNWNLEMLVFEERGKLENPEKNSKMVVKIKQCLVVMWWLKLNSFWWLCGG